MKIGLCLAFKGAYDNYGMLLQAYATQQILEMDNYETEIIDYKRTDWKHVRLTLALIPFIISEKRKKRDVAGDELTDEIHIKNAEDRHLSADAFRSVYLHNIVECCGIEQLEKLAMTYNGVLVGSDQVWPPSVSFGNFYTLRFVPDNINKISYATSLGVSDYPRYCRGSARNFMKRINHMSVREKQGSEIIHRICKKHAEVVLDPTYMLTCEQWLERIPNNGTEEPKYILCYFLGNNPEQKIWARKYADRKGLKLVSVLSPESISDIDISFADEILTGKSPSEFINYIRNAEFVLTDSFHGVAFSIINKKQFYVFYRTKYGSRGSRNSRIDNILKLWQLESRLVNDLENNEGFDEQSIDYIKVDAILENERKRSMKFLTKALGDCR